MYLPLIIKNRTLGVIFYESTHEKDCFTELSEANLKWLAIQTSLYFALTIQFNREIIETRSSDLEISGRPNPNRGSEIISGSPIMADLLTKVDRIADSDSSVLILGETGVGKELLALRLHQVSSRSAGPFDTFAPGSVPENLVESELFGHEKGAFTGADNRRHGLVELADKGTLFIDEIGDFTPAVQVKLLRVLQEKTFRRVGGNQVRRSIFRLVVATNRNMAQEVATGGFREDLLYRINTVTFNVPPLREREKVTLACWLLIFSPGLPEKTDDRYPH